MLILNLHILFFLCCTFAVAQEKKSQEPNKAWEIGINASMPMFDFKTEANRYNRTSVWNLTNLLSQNVYERKIYWYTKIGNGTLNFQNKTLTKHLNNTQLKPRTIPEGKSRLFNLADQMPLNTGTQWSQRNTDRLDKRKIKSTNIE